MQFKVSLASIASLIVVAATALHGVDASAFKARAAAVPQVRICSTATSTNTCESFSLLAGLCVNLDNLLATKLANITLAGQTVCQFWNGQGCEGSVTAFVGKNVTGQTGLGIGAQSFLCLGP